MMISHDTEVFFPPPFIFAIVTGIVPRQKRSPRLVTPFFVFVFFVALLYKPDRRNRFSLRISSWHDPVDFFSMP